jgi:tRNA dimethylallyltransferase
MTDKLKLGEGHDTAERFCDRDVLLIAGPTASGKSARAISIAKATGGVVINADSMQIYDGLRILTARPTVEEERTVEHQLYGFVSPSIAFSVGDYSRLILPLLAQLKREKRLAVIVGGTGLYFNALTQGLVAIPEIPDETIEQVKVMQASGEDLHHWLQREDPESAKRLSPADEPRLQRAVAVKMATNKTLGEWQRESTQPILQRSSWHGLFLAPGRAKLYARIDARFHTMLEQGALDEVRAIASMGLPSNRGVMKSHGMPHLLAHLRGDLALEEAIRLGQQDTRNYAKRQFTWARRFMADWSWFDL